MATNEPKGTPSKVERETSRNDEGVEKTTEDAAQAYAKATPATNKVKSGAPGTFAGTYKVNHFESKPKKVKDGDPGTYAAPYKVKHFVSGETDSKKS